MSKLKTLVCASMFAASAAASAASPIVKLDVTDSLKRGLDFDVFNFSISNAEAGLYSASLNLLPKQGRPAEVGFAIEKQGSSFFDIVGLNFGPGSFTFNATAGNYFAVVLGENFSRFKAPYHFEVSSVSPVPEPSTWAMLMLGVGLVAYQGARGRRAGQTIKAA